MAASQQRRNPGQAGNPRQTKVYIDGNTVRKVQYQAIPEEQPLAPARPRQQQRAVPGKRRQRSLQMSAGYVFFLTAAVAASLFMAVRYLNLQSESTALRSQITRLESQYSSLKMENDEEYARILSDVDLEYVRDVAINKLGMVYAVSGQVLTYDGQDGDFVRQYEDVPAE